MEVLLYILGIGGALIYLIVRTSNKKDVAIESMKPDNYKKNKWKYIFLGLLTYVSLWFVYYLFASHQDWGTFGIFLYSWWIIYQPIILILSRIGPALLFGVLIWWKRNKFFGLGFLMGIILVPLMGYLSLIIMNFFHHIMY